MNWRKIYCFFGKHKQARNPIELKPSRFEIFGEKLIFCERCKKILFVGYFPPEHPNCLCQTYSPSNHESTGHILHTDNEA